jgi:hypothetical protein
MHEGRLAPPREHPMKRFLFWFGALTVALYVLGAVGIGEFVYCYGPEGFCRPLPTVTNLTK